MPFVIPCPDPRSGKVFLLGGKPIMVLGLEPELPEPLERESP